MRPDSLKFLMVPRPAGSGIELVLSSRENGQTLSLEPPEHRRASLGVSIVDAVVHRGRSIDVDTVMVDGEIVTLDRRLTGVDKEALFKELKNALDRPLRADELDRRDLAKQVEPHLRRFFQGTVPQDQVPHSVYNARA